LSSVPGVTPLIRTFVALMFVFAVINNVLPKIFVFAELNVVFAELNVVFAVTEVVAPLNVTGPERVDVPVALSVFVVTELAALNVFALSKN